MQHNNDLKALQLVQNNHLGLNGIHYSVNHVGLTNTDTDTHVLG